MKLWHSTRMLFFLMILFRLCSSILCGMDDCDSLIERHLSGEDDYPSIGELFANEPQELVLSLHDAVYDGNVRVVRTYVKNKVFDINEIDVFGDTPLHKTSLLKNQERRYAIIEILLEGKANPNKLDTYNKRNCLYSFVSSGYANEVNLLLEYKADIGLQDYCNNTIFHLMATCISNDDSSIYSNKVLKTCFALPFLRLKTLLLCKKNIEHNFKIKIPRPLVHIIACLADPQCKFFLDSTFNKSLTKKNNEGNTAYDILYKKYGSEENYQWCIKLLNPVEKK